MKCPKCDSLQTIVQNVYRDQEVNETGRRRKCLNCGEHFGTVERIGRRDKRTGIITFDYDRVKRKSKKRRRKKMIDREERKSISDTIDRIVEDAQKNIPTPTIGKIDPVWWNSQEGKVIRSHFKTALHSLGESLKYSLSQIGR